MLLYMFIGSKTEHCGEMSCWCNGLHARLAIKTLRVQFCFMVKLCKMSVASGDNASFDKLQRDHFLKTQNCQEFDSCQDMSGLCPRNVGKILSGQTVYC